jgi:hypothetical protein
MAELTHIKGITTEIIKELREADPKIETIEHLRQEAATSEGRERIAAQVTGGDPAQVLEWFYYADLLAVSEITPLAAEMLIAAKINSVSELAEMSPVEVFQRLKEWQERQKDYRSFTWRDVKQWVGGARKRTGGQRIPWLQQVLTRRGLRRAARPERPVAAALPSTEPPSARPSSWRRVLFAVLGALLIGVAVYLYVRTMVGLSEVNGFEVWRMLTVLITWPFGWFLMAMSIWPLQAPDDVRLEGPGKEATEKKRKVWMRDQTSRSFHITAVAASVIIIGLALYIASHLVRTGQEVRWQTHEERLAALTTYQVEKDDTLEGVAAKHKVSPEALAEANPEAMLAASGPFTSTRFTPSKVFQVEAGKEIRLGDAAAQLGISKGELASGFPRVVLEAGQNLTIPKVPAIDHRQWLDWAYWALIGVAAYLLMVDARYYRKIQEGEGDFLRETLWYWAQFFTGPLIAFVVLLLLTQVNLQLLGDESGAAISVDMSKFSPDLLFLLAFLLGFYSRVARQVLDDIAKTIFRSAWLAAVEKFEIVIKGRKPGANWVRAGEVLVFDTEPATNVKWFTKAGDINEATGVYTAPKEIQEPQDDVVTAMAVRGDDVDSMVLHILSEFSISATVDENPLTADQTVAPGSKIAFKVTHSLSQEAAKGIKWCVDPGGAPFQWEAGEAGESVVGVVRTDAKADISITVTAEYQGLKSPITFKVGTPPPAQIDKITARLSDGSEADEGVNVKTGDSLEFEVSHNLSDEEANKISWSVDNLDAFNLEAEVGPSATGTAGTVTAETDVAVTAAYNDQSASFAFKVVSEPPPGEGGGGETEDEGDAAGTPPAGADDAGGLA